jgi:hypothetical protein
MSPPDEVVSISVYDLMSSQTTGSEHIEAPLSQLVALVKYLLAVDVTVNPSDNIFNASSDLDLGIRCRMDDGRIARRSWERKRSPGRESRPAID